MKITILVLLLIILPPIGSVLVFVLTGEEAFIYIAWALIVLLIFTLFNKSFKSKFNIGYLGNEEEFLDSILQLLSLVIKADGKINESGIYWVEKKIKNDFKEPHADKYIKELSDYLEKDISLIAVCAKVNRQFNYSSKIQLLHFLIRLSIIDDKFSDEERDLFRRIARSLRLSAKVLNSILAMFNLDKKNKSQKTYSKSSTKSSRTTLEMCYQILGIQQTVTDKQVKKAFRKLAVLHHPDKVAHLGESLQRSAVIKFQKISDAYETIKAKRGFS